MHSAFPKKLSYIAYHLKSMLFQSQPLQCLFSDPRWQLVIGIVALIIAIIFGLPAFLYRNRKRFAWTVVSNVPLFDIHATRTGVKERVRIFFDEQLVENVSLLLVEIINEGSAPILASEFERPFSLSVEGDSRILTSEVVSTVPESLRPIVKHDEQKVTLEPLLMNSSDQIIVKMLVSNYNNNLYMDGRIVGVSDIVREISRAEIGKVREGTAMLVGGVTYLVASTVYYLFIASDELQRHMKENYYSYVKAAIVLMGLAILSGAITYAAPQTLWRSISRLISRSSDFKKKPRNKDA